ncbi:MAG: hypothetical protein K6E29_02275 [Cyanobacteria bacterium RUI128]|nr:hypothetical protein [Cyanobacteria bacterium RUI128]
MNVNGVRNFLLGTVMATSLGGCKQAFKEVKNVEPVVSEALDSVANRTAKVLEDRTYRFFGRDTIPLRENFNKNITGYINEMNDSAIANIPTRLEDARLVLVRTPLGSDVVCHEIRKPIYKDAKAVVVSPKVFEKGGEQYIPVEYYGK